MLYDAVIFDLEDAVAPDQNDPARISKGYNVMDHFAEGWAVAVVPEWPVARLPLQQGEYTAFMEK